MFGKSTPGLADSLAYEAWLAGMQASGVGAPGLRIGEAAAPRLDRVDLLRGRGEVVEAFSEVRGKLILGSTKTGARQL